MKKRTCSEQEKKKEEKDASLGAAMTARRKHIRSPSLHACFIAVR